MSGCAVVFAVIALFVALFAAWVLVVQWAWNTLVPALFGGPTIDFVQALAIAVLLSAVSGGTRYVTKESA